VRADAQAGDKDAVQSLRKEAAVRNVDGVPLLLRMFNQEIRIDGVAVRIEVRVRDRDCVGICAVRHLIQDGHRVVAYDATPLAGVDKAAEIEVRSKLALAVNQEVPYVLHVDFVGDGVVGVGVAGVQFHPRQACALLGNFTGIGVSGPSSRGSGDVGVAGRIDDGLG